MKKTRHRLPYSLATLIIASSLLIIPTRFTAQTIPSAGAENESQLLAQPKPATVMDDYSAAAEAYFRNDKGGYKAFKRLEDYMLNRLGPGGQIVNSTAKTFRAYQDKIQQAPTGRMTGGYNGDWEFQGPYAVLGEAIETLGRVNRFAFHPTDENIIFAATAGGGLWRSNDKGINWVPLSDGIPVMNTTGVAVDWDDPQTLYLLTGDGDGVGSFYGFNEFTRTSIGVLKSTNGGGVWRPTGLVFDETSAVLAYNLYISPEDRETLYATTNVGMFRTRNGGASWDTIRPGRIYEMEFKPEDAQRIYCIDTSYVFISEDGGDTWVDSFFIPAIDGRVGRMTMTTCPGNPEMIYVLASPLDTLDPLDSLPDHRGLWVSDNAGQDFTLVSTRPNLMAGHSGTEFKSQAWYDFSMACNPENENELLVGTIGVWQSPDGGQSWENDSGINTYYHADIHEIRVNPLDNNVYMGTDGGVSHSDNFGHTWVPRWTSPSVTQYYKIASSPFYSHLTLAGSQDNGVQLRYNETTFFKMVAWGDGMESMYHPTVDTLVMSSTQNGRILISRDTGHTFSVLLPEKSDNNNDTAVWTTPMAFDASDQDVIYIGYRPVMKSTDQGETFFATSHDTISAHKILVNNLSNPNRLYVGDCVNCGNANLRFNMFMSPDAGATWTKIDTMPGFPGVGKFVSAAVVNPDNSQEIWITCGRFDEGEKVFRSMDAGATWTNESGTLPNVPVNAIVYEDNDGNPSGAVYIGTDIGVFYRNDNLGDWIYFSNSLPAVEIADLDIDYIGGYVLAGTYGRGLWRSELFTQCIGQMTLNTGNQIKGHSYAHQAGTQIQSTAHVDGYGSRVLYSSGHRVKLNEGFHATSRNKAVFMATLSPCSSGGIPVFFQENEGDVSIQH